MNAQYGSLQLTRQALTTLQTFAASQLRDQPRSAISIQSAHADAAIRAQQGQQIFTGDVVPPTQTTDGVGQSPSPAAPEQFTAQANKKKRPRKGAGMNLVNAVFYCKALYVAQRLLRNDCCAL